MQAQDFEPMSIGGILDRTFKIYKNNFIRFITIVAIIQVPIALLMAVSTSVLQRGAPVKQEIDFDQFKPDAEQNAESINSEEFRPDFGNSNEEVSNPAVFILGIIGFIIGVILSMLGHALCSGALTKSVSESYLGREMTVGDAYRFIWPKFLTIIAAGLLVALVVWFGLLLLIVPGIIFGLWFALTIPIIIVEDLKATQGMSRSKDLASGNLGKIFSIGFLVMVISWVVSIPFGFVGGFLGKILFSNNVMLVTFVNQLSSVAGQILAVPISSIAYILLYYDLRIRKEGFDLQMLASSVGSEQGELDVNEP